MPRRTDRQCQFCSERAVDTFLATCDGSRLYGDATARLFQRAPLCGRHAALLQAAGSRGRVHGPTGVRWWLGDRRPPAARMQIREQPPTGS